MFHHLFALIIGRFIIGLSVGVYSVVVPIFINEISPAKMKGSYGVASQIFITAGIF